MEGSFDDILTRFSSTTGAANNKAPHFAQIA